MNSITGKAVARSARTPVPRPETLIELARDWRNRMPQFGRFDLSVEQEKRSLIIREIRLGASKSTSPLWDADATEYGVSIFQATLLIAPHKFDLSVAILAGVSLHALARRFQRGWDVSPSAVLGDLHALARAHAALETTANDDFEVAAGGGRWVGRCVADCEAKQHARRTDLPQRRRMTRTLASLAMTVPDHRTATTPQIGTRQAVRPPCRAAVLMAVSYAKKKGPDINGLDFLHNS